MSELATIGGELSGALSTYAEAEVVDSSSLG
jgi:hypothetical protein